MKYDTKRQSIYLWINSDSTICTRQIVDHNDHVFFVKYALNTDLFIFVTPENLFFECWEQITFYSQFLVNVSTYVIGFSLDQPLLMHLNSTYPVLEYAVVLEPMHSPTRWVVSWQCCL